MSLAFTDRLAAPGQALLWLDDLAYSQRLLCGGGGAPWLDVTGCVAYRRQAVGLLRPGVNVLPVAPIARAWVAAQPALREAMSGGRRAGAPLRTLLADTSLRAHLAELVQGLQAALPRLPLALALPSPRAWVVNAHRQARGGAPNPAAGADDIDTGAVYLADFLRGFGGLPLEAVLLEEATDDEPASAEEIGWYQPVFNACEHFRWACGLRLPHASGLVDAVTALSFAIAPRALAGVPTGLALPDTFWRDASPPPERPGGGFLAATLPADAQPETVLARMATLRP